MPVIPFITDSIKMLDSSIRNIKEAEVDFIIFGGMTLKEGRQKDHFLSLLKKHSPELLIHYENIYRQDKWGNPNPEYHRALSGAFNMVAKNYKINKRIPLYLFKDMLDENDLVVVMLEQMEIILQQWVHKLDSLGNVFRAGRKRRLRPRASILLLLAKNHQR